MAADCETDGYLSSSGLQEPSEGPPPELTPAPIAPTTTTTVETPHPESPSPVVELEAPVPALRFPSVGRLCARGEVRYPNPQFHVVNVPECSRNNKDDQDDLED